MSTIVFVSCSRHLDVKLHLNVSSLELKSIHSTYIIGPVVVQNSHIFGETKKKGNTRRLCNFVDFARELRVATSMYSKGPNCIQAYMQSSRAFTTLILNNASGNPDQQEEDVK